MDTGNCKCLHEVSFKPVSVYLIAEREDFSGRDTEALVSLLCCLIYTHFLLLAPIIWMTVVSTCFILLEAHLSSSCCMNAVLSYLVILAELIQIG